MFLAMTRNRDCFVGRNLLAMTRNRDCFVTLFLAMTRNRDCFVGRNLLAMTDSINAPSEWFICVIASAAKQSSFQKGLLRHIVPRNDKKQGLLRRPKPPRNDKKQGLLRHDVPRNDRQYQSPL